VKTICYVIFGELKPCGDVTRLCGPGSELEANLPVAPVLLELDSPAIEEGKNPQQAPPAGSPHQAKFVIEEG
jgi:hypothetical protein